MGDFTEKAEILATFKRIELRALSAALTYMQSTYKDECTAAERPGMQKALRSMTELIQATQARKP